MKKLFRVGLTVCVLVATSALAWWLFGWSTNDNPALGVFTYQRFFARVTTVYLDSNRDGDPDVRVSSSWPEPIDVEYYDHCVDLGTEMAEDRDFDGRWDVWTRNLGPTDTGGCLTEFNVDTSGDGKPDWRFQTTDSMQAYDDIAARRGF